MTRKQAKRFLKGYWKYYKKRTASLKEVNADLIQKIQEDYVMEKVK